ncbi:MAG: hypothetical protein AAGD35_14260 [Actinomycetota bacterium]
MSRKTGRRTRAETAELVRETAVRLLQANGLQGFANSVRLDEALALLEAEQGIRLTHGSVYGRIWQDQRDFQLDVVSTALSRYDGAEIAAAMDPAASSERFSIEEAFTRAVEAARASRPWNLWLGAHTAVVSTPERDDDERLGAALADARRQVEASVAERLAARSDAPHDLPGFTGGFVTLLVGVSLGAAPMSDEWLRRALASLDPAPQG